MKVVRGIIGCITVGLMFAVMGGMEQKTMVVGLGAALLGVLALVLAGLILGGYYAESHH